ncbi:MAG: leucine-rich repeat domain-containing protein [Bacteroidetes bacterium]|nr:leucine-rich repeat domain-containing protein [Bacteroidota bacterium]
MKTKHKLSLFCNTALLLLAFCGTGWAQEQKELLDSAQLVETYTFMSLTEALEHPEMVIKLELRKQKIKTFPPEIFQFKNLQWLDLGRNQLKEIPDSLYKLNNLQYLDVSRNKLGSLPKEIGKCGNLFYLNANNNDLYFLPPQIGNLENLRMLDLWSNDLSDFPETMQNLKNLTTIDIRGILISDDVVKKLKRMLPHTHVASSPPCNCKL